MGKNMMFLKNFGEAFGYQLLGDITKYSCTIVYSLYIDYIYTFTNTCIYIYTWVVCMRMLQNIYTIKYHNMIVGFYLQLCVLHPSKLPKVCGSGWSNDQRKLISQRPVSVLRSCPRPPPKKWMNVTWKGTISKGKQPSNQHFSVDMLVFQGVHLFVVAFMKDIAIFNVKMRWRLQKEYMWYISSKL